MANGAQKHVQQCNGKGEKHKIENSKREKHKMEKKEKIKA